VFVALARTARIQRMRTWGRESTTSRNSSQVSPMKRGSVSLPSAPKDFGMEGTQPTSGTLATSA
jgi:hypothetical protein